MVLLAGFDLELWRSFLDGAKRFHHEDGMMRDNCASAFAHNGGVRDAFGIAYVHIVPDRLPSTSDWQQRDWLYRDRIWRSRHHSATICQSLCCTSEREYQCRVRRPPRST